MHNRPNDSCGAASGLRSCIWAQASLLHRISHCYPKFTPSMRFPTATPKLLHPSDFTFATPSLPHPLDFTLATRKLCHPSVFTFATPTLLHPLDFTSLLESFPIHRISRRHPKATSSTCSHSLPQRYSMHMFTWLLQSYSIPQVHILYPNATPSHRLTLAMPSLPHPTGSHSLPHRCPIHIGTHSLPQSYPIHIGPHSLPQSYSIHIGPHSLPQSYSIPQAHICYLIATPSPELQLFRELMRLASQVQPVL